MTADELLKAVNEASLTPERLTLVLGAAGKLVDREILRSKEAAIRAEAAKSAAAYEVAIQAANAEFRAADEATQKP